MYIVFEYQTSKEQPSYATVMLRILVRNRISFFFSFNFQMIMNDDLVLIWIDLNWIDELSISDFVFCLVDQTAQEPVHVLCIRFVSRSPACILNFEQLQSAI